MPKMSGLDLHNNLSRLGKEIPTVMITAYPSDDMRAARTSSRVICYLPKPFDESDLLNCIQALWIAQREIEARLSLCLRCINGHQACVSLRGGRRCTSITSASQRVRT